MKIKLHYLFVVLAFILTASALPAWAQPSMSAEYKQAAQAYYAAAAKETDPASASCDKAWGDYYTCVANSLVSGANVTCTAPTCQPGSGQGSAATTYSVNGQPTSQGTFQQGVDNSLNRIAAAIASPKTRNLGIAQGAFDIAGFFAKKAMETEGDESEQLKADMEQAQQNEDAAYQHLHDLELQMTNMLENAVSDIKSETELDQKKIQLSDEQVSNICMIRFVSAKKVLDISMNMLKQMDNKTSASKVYEGKVKNPLIDFQIDTFNAMGQCLSDIKGIMTVDQFDAYLRINASGVVQKAYISKGLELSSDQLDKLNFVYYQNFLKLIEINKDKTFSREDILSFINSSGNDIKTKEKSILDYDQFMKIYPNE